MNGTSVPDRQRLGLTSYLFHCGPRVLRILESAETGSWFVAFENFSFWQQLQLQNVPGHVLKILGWTAASRPILTIRVPYGAARRARAEGGAHADGQTVGGRAKRESDISKKIIGTAVCVKPA